MANALKKERFQSAWYGLLKKSIRLPGTRVNREEFLKKELHHFYKSDMVEQAAAAYPQHTAVSSEVLEQVARRCINRHAVMITFLSFLAGMPGGWWMLVTIPMDLTQFYCQTLRLSQKLAYLYGWPDIFEGSGSKEPMLKMNLLWGAMFGSREAALLAGKLSKRLTVQATKEITQRFAARVGLYNLFVQGAKWIGVTFTQESLETGFVRTVPLVGGFVSAVISLILIKTMSYNLLKFLRDK
ncbi:hypothetical protein [Candidatus Contubernalis alkaliaceticus]|uniref:hypothetical protein n=1 Tax=Candidatus Contubernalis alkaliaceticus TaxID=338645 RepID=UPI001F4BD718|nr:hypothetical protein [Candidatus Contubernalis alkalaceticus]UNC90826.1 hypothetical protein HUE98_01235 [Candidatus Contubernalis alkalaceticus]